LKFVVIPLRERNGSEALALWRVDYKFLRAIENFGKPILSDWQGQRFFGKDYLPTGLSVMRRSNL